MKIIDTKSTGSCDDCGPSPDNMPRQHSLFRVDARGKFLLLCLGCLSRLGEKIITRARDKA